eukprot:5593696-Pleurochrysis_carterae.AAC.1
MLSQSSRPGSRKTLGSSSMNSIPSGSVTFRRLPIALSTYGLNSGSRSVALSVNLVLKLTCTR